VQCLSGLVAGCRWVTELMVGWPTWRALEHALAEDGWKLVLLLRCGTQLHGSGQGLAAGIWLAWLPMARPRAATGVMSSTCGHHQGCQALATACDSRRAWPLCAGCQAATLAASVASSSDGSAWQFLSVAGPGCPLVPLACVMSSPLVCCARAQAFPAHPLQRAELCSVQHSVAFLAVLVVRMAVAWAGVPLLVRGRAHSAASQCRASPMLLRKMGPPAGCSGLSTDPMG
jgi:hypothetical protein